MRMYACMRMYAHAHASMRLHRCILSVYLIHWNIGTFECVMYGRIKLDNIYVERQNLEQPVHICKYY